MDFENENNQPEVNESAAETQENTQEQYTGCDEDLSEELTDEEYEKMVADVMGEPEKKASFFDFIHELKNQAVCKLIFLFAAIGFIFPFFTVSCDGQLHNTYSTTGISTFKDLVYSVGGYGDLFVSRQWILIAAFAIIIIGLILTVFFKNEIRYIAGLVCSLASAACIGVFYYMMPTLLSDSMNTFLTRLSKDISSAYGTTIDLTDSATLSEMKLDLSGLKAIPAAGMYFVFALLIINAIYFIVQLSANSKKKAAVEMTLTEGEFPEDFDETLYNEESGQESQGVEEEAESETDSQQEEEKTEE